MKVRVLYGKYGWEFHLGWQLEIMLASTECSLGSDVNFFEIGGTYWLIELWRGQLRSSELLLFSIDVSGWYCGREISSARFHDTTATSFNEASDDLNDNCWTLVSVRLSLPRSFLTFRTVLFARNRWWTEFLWAEESSSILVPGPAVWIGAAMVGCR